MGAAGDDGDAASRLQFDIAFRGGGSSRDVGAMAAFYAFRFWHA